MGFYQWKELFWNHIKFLKMLVEVVHLKIKNTNNENLNLYKHDKEP